MLKESFILNNGISIPKLALGTWQVPNDVAITAVKDALSVGYRHIDTASAYQNETGVGIAIKESNIPRSEIFVTSKVPAEIKSYVEAKDFIDGSLSKLNVDYIDLMLIHAPKPWDEMVSGSTKAYFEENLAVWRALEEAYIEGKLKAIGVSNFEVNDLQNIIENGTIKPQANQIRVHIGHVPTDVIRYCEDNDILVQAFSPNATGRLIGTESIEAMAKKYNVTIPQLAIRFDLQLGLLPIPKTTHKEYMISNSEVDFTIADEDMEILMKVPEI
ncbi:MAG: aldo/keto reductase [Solibacillus sp.]